jgi:hypothetical protein
MTRSADPFKRVRRANPVIAPVEPDIEQIRERLSQEPPETPVRPVRRTRTARNAYRIAATLALLAALSATTVLMLAPSGSSPDFLARAAAALAPTNGTVLYERWQATIEPEPGNPGRRVAVAFGPEQLWIEGGRPHRYRTVLQPRRDRRVAAGSSGGARLAYRYGVSFGYSGPVRLEHSDIDALALVRRDTEGRPLELGGSVENASGKTYPGEVRPTLTYLGSDKFLRARMSATLGPVLPGPHDQAIENGADPVSALRSALREGRAHAAGSVDFNGRTVQRIDLLLPNGLPAGAPPLPGTHPPLGSSHDYALVEAGSFHPLEIVFGGQIYRFLDYRYLPATAANLALTDIRAQHPRARTLNTLTRSHHAGPL